MCRVAKFLASLLFPILFIASCAMNPADEDLIKSIFEQVRAQRFDEFEAHLSTDKRTNETRAVLQKIANELIPTEAPADVKLLNWTSAVTLERRNVEAVHRYTYSDRILTVVTSLEIPKEGPYSIVNFNVNMSDLSEAELTAFSLAGKPLQQLAFFGALLLSVVIMVGALIAVLLTRQLKRKWLWAIAAFAGAPVFLMNWSTGEWQILFSLGLINTGVTTGLAPGDPWMLKFQAPLGAIAVFIMLLQRRRNVGDREEISTGK